MRVECEICGAYTEDPNEIEWAKRNRICPGCRHIGSLFIAKEDSHDVTDDIYFDENWLEEQAEIAEYKRIAYTNPYIFTEDRI